MSDAEPIDVSRVVIIVAVVFIIGLSIGSNLPGIIAHGPPEPYSTNVKVFFSTHTSCSNEVIKLINNANSTIYIAIYSFTSQNIADALIAAGNRGIKIYVIGEPSQRTEGNMFSYIGRYENIKVSFDTGSGIMHNKFMIVDGVYVTTGSFNWTTAAETENAENMLLITDKNVAALYKAEWDWLAINRT